MVLDSSTDNKSKSFSSSSSPGNKALHIWKKFKKVKPEEPQNIEKNEVKLPRMPTTTERSETHSLNSSSSSSHGCKTQISNRTIMTEKLFNRQLENHRQRQSRDSSLSTNSSFDSVDRKRGYLKSDYHNKENHKSPNMTGVLHFKKPLSANSADAEKYYENRGRMDHQSIDWKNGATRPTSLKKEPEIQKKPEMPEEKIEATAVSKPLVSDEFSNFVKNSVHRNVAYNPQGNIERNANTSDCSIFKIQQLINKGPLETIQIPAKVRTSFLKPEMGFHLFNRIDNFKVQNPEKNASSKVTEVARQDKPHISKHRDAPNENSHHNQYSNMPNRNERLDNTEPKQERKSFNNELKPRNTDNNYPQNAYQSKQTNEDSNHDKYTQNGMQRRNFCSNNESRESMQSFKRVMLQPRDDKKFDYGNRTNADTPTAVQNEAGVKKEEVAENDRPTHDCDDDDDMISYVNALSHEENVAKRESRKQGLEMEDDLFNFVQNPSEPSSEISNLPAPPARKLSSHNHTFDRMKMMCEEKAKLNKTGDSDDTFNVSSDVESLSVSIVSTRDRFRAFKKKRMLESTLAHEQTEKSPVLPDENDDSKVLENKNQLLNRCLRASHNYQKVHEDNVVEITNVKVGPKPEPLLKPISTRYFEKPIARIETPSDDNSNEAEKTENLQEEKKENSNLDSCVKNNASIENISTIVAYNVDVDSKVDLKNESNNKIPLEVDQEGIEIDSGLCIKSFDNPEVIPNVSSTRFDSEIGNDKNCDVSSHEDVTEPISISETNKSSVQANNEHLTKSEVTKKYETQPEIVKDMCKFEELSSGSKNDMMDCEDYIDFDAFELENIDMWFPGLNQKVESIKEALSNGTDSNNGPLSITDNPNNNENQSLDSDGESSNNNYSSLNTSGSSNFNADSENSSNSCSPFNFNSVFDKVDIKLSELKTSGLDYGDNQKKETESTTQKVSNKNVVVKQGNSQTNSVSQKKPTNKKNTGKENIEKDLKNNNEVSTIQHPEEPKHRNDTNITPKPVSKKMQKYRSTLKNYKNKLKTEADTKEDDKNVQQIDDVPKNDNSSSQESLKQGSIVTAVRESMSQFFFKNKVVR